MALGSGSAAAADQRRVLAQDRLLQRRPGPGPGSTPSSATSTVRAWCKVRSASPWRPAWYWASASSAHRRSRNGASATRACASASTSRW